MKFRWLKELSSFNIGTALGIMVASDIEVASGIEVAFDILATSGVMAAIDIIMGFGGVI